MKYTEEDYTRIKTIIPMGEKPSTFIMFNEHSVPQEAIDYINKLLKTYNLNDNHCKDLYFSTCYYIGTINKLKRDESCFYSMHKQYIEDKKQFAKLFKNCEGDFIGGIALDIEAISFTSNTEKRPIRIDKKKDYRLISRITKALYQLHLDMEKETLFKKISPRFEVEIKKAMSQFFWLYQYIHKELKITKKESCKIVSEFIKSLGYELVTEQLEKDYLYNIFKKNPFTPPPPK